MKILAEIKKNTNLIICFYLQQIIYRKRNEIHKENKIEKSNPVNERGNNDQVNHYKTSTKYLYQRQSSLYCEENN